MEVIKMKAFDFVKIQNIGVGKIQSIYDGKDVSINICDTSYYRDLSEDTDVELATEKEYIEFIKFMVKELTAKSKTKRSEAAQYNKDVEGEATRRKGKVSVINGNYAFGLCENSISSHHRGLLEDAKKAKELKDKLKKEIAWYKHRDKLIKEAEKERENRENNAG